MSYKICSSYGYSYLWDGSRDESGRIVETKISGQLCNVDGLVGRLWCVRDNQSHCGGHGMGNIYSSSVIMALPNMAIKIVSKDSEVFILNGADW